MKKAVSVIFAAAFILLMLISPDRCRSGALSGLELCGRVVIPSLFPFAVCALMLMRAGAANGFKKIFGAYGECAAVILLSSLGGYPVGAGLVRELYSSGALDRKSARLLLCCSVNAGPAFLVIAVGSGVFGSRTAGYVLLFSHIAANLIIAAAILPFIKPSKAAHVEKSAGDLFVGAAADAAGSMLSVCAFVIFFSAFTAYLSAAAVRFPFLRAVSDLCEVTAGTARCGNFYIAAFLLGFAGFSVWFQVMAAAGEVGLSPLFAPARLAQGILSALLAFLLCKILRLRLPTVGNGISFGVSSTVSGAAAAVSLAVMLLLLILRLSSGKPFRLKGEIL